MQQQVKLTLGRLHPVAEGLYQSFRPATLLLIQLPDKVHPAGGRWVKFLGACHPCRRPRRSFKLYFWTSITMPVVGIWGMNQQVEDSSLSLPIPLSLLLFPIPREKNSFIYLKEITTYLLVHSSNIRSGWQARTQIRVSHMSGSNTITCTVNCCLLEPALGTQTSQKLSYSMWNVGISTTGLNAYFCFCIFKWLKWSQKNYYIGATWTLYTMQISISNFIGIEPGSFAYISSMTFFSYSTELCS